MRTHNVDLPLRYSMICALCCVSLAALAVCPLELAAQPAEDARKTDIALTGGLTYIDFGGIGGFGSFVMQVRLSHRFGSASGAELSVFSVVPGGAATTDASCIPGGVCSGFSTPSSLSGVTASFVRFLGESGFRASLGIGGVKTHSGEGLGATESIAGTVGLDLVARRSWRLRPTIGLRVMRLAKPASRVRHIFLPGVGLVF